MSRPKINFQLNFEQSLLKENETIVSEIQENELHFKLENNSFEPKSGQCLLIKYQILTIVYKMW